MGVTKLKIITDSRVVYGWLNLIKTKSANFKITGLSEMLIRRRLLVIEKVLLEAETVWCCEWIRSEDNKADQLTRVPRKWIIQENTCASVRRNCEDSNQAAKQSHERHHFGVKKSRYLAKREGIEVSNQEMRQIIQECSRCNSIDPAPIKVSRGYLSIGENWQRLAMDHTHYNNQVFLSIIDCGPSRFSIWRKVASESSEDVVSVCRQLFMERGPPDEILTDNGGAFVGNEFKNLCKSWNVYVNYRCAHRPSTNGIVERCHRTIKRVAKRANISIAEAVYWYNISPRTEANKKCIPCEILFNYKWRVKNEAHDSSC